MLFIVILYEGRKSRFTDGPIFGGKVNSEERKRVGREEETQ